jgi:hypothetical protein
MKKLFCFSYIFLFAILDYGQPKDILVDWECNMQIEILTGRFNPATDTVSVRGDFNLWSRYDLIESPLDPDIYISEFPVLIENVEVGDTIVNYKFFYTPATWEIGNNKFYVLTLEDYNNGEATISRSFNDLTIATVTNQETTIQFTVDCNDAVSAINGLPFPVVNTVHIAGGTQPLQWPSSGWPNGEINLMIPMFDDGINGGDPTAGDKIFNALVTFPPFTEFLIHYKYGINYGDGINNGGGNDNENAVGATHIIELEQLLASAQVLNTFGTMGVHQLINKVYSNLTVLLTSPNGGENWAVGTNQSITWVSNNITNVKIEYTTDGGSSWITIISSTPSDGIHGWTIPNTPSGNCKVKISDVTNPSTFDQSNNPFSIIQPSVTVTSPNGGESWLVSSVHNITWSSSNVTNVKIEYSTNSGASWIIITYSTPSDGSYSWTVPNAPSNNCRVKISDVANLSVYDESNGDFSIVQPSVTVSSPNGGEGWQIATVQNITWTSSNVTNVKIEYTTNNGSSWITVISSTPSDGTYEWTIPNTPSTQCKVKISDVANPGIYDVSNSTFSIVQFVFYALIQADSVWLDSGYDGQELGLVDGSGSYISQGTIINYEWYVNNEFITNGVSPTIELTTGTSIVKLIVYSSTGYNTSDSMYVSVYAAKLATGGAILSGISQYGNSFYVTSMNNGVYRIDSTGTILQSYITGGSIQSSLCISNETNLMYVGSTDTRLYCFDTGLNSLWDRGLGGVVNNSASVNFDGSIVYVGANDNNTNLGLLKSLVASNGNPKWTFQADGTILSSPVVMELVDSNYVVIKTIIYFGTSKGTVYAINDFGTSYELFWSETVNPDSAFVSSPAISEDGMLYIGSKNGYLYRFNWDGNYQTSWRKYTGGPIISSPIIDENEIVYIASGSGYIYGFHKNFLFNSDPVKTFYQSVGINGTAGIGPDGTLLVGCDNGKFFALDKNATELEMPIKWYFQATGPVLAPTLVTNNGIVYIGATNGDIFIMRDLYLSEKQLSLSDYEWPTFKGDNQRSKVVRLVAGPTSVGDENNVITNYYLYQNYPNPFNPSTRIKFQIPNRALVTLKIFDVLGNEVGVLVNREMETGSYEVEFHASNLPSGIYFYQLKAGNYTETKKMILLK